MKFLMKTSLQSYLLLFSSVITYAYIAYFLERIEFIPLFVSYSFLFVFLFKLISLNKQNYQLLILAAIIMILKIKADPRMEFSLRSAAIVKHN